ncbi:MAG: 30S ribosomal protein S4 [Patescibacteria group bacterium]
MPSRISRRLGEKFFFKAERDSSPKSAMVRRPYPPGMHGKRRRRSASEFGAELAEKQKIRYLYGLSDAALARVIREASRVRGRTKTQALVELLERRLDNVVFRLGLAPSRRIARHLVSYGHITVHGRRVRSPGLLVRPGDQIGIRPESRGGGLFEGLASRLKKHEPPAWLLLRHAEEAGEVKRLPQEADELLTYNLSKVIEYYSR